jgi:hypothetical protein
MSLGTEQSSPPRASLPTSGRSPSGSARRRGGRAPARHRGAHLVANQAGKQHGRPKPLGPAFSSSSTDARVELSQIGGDASRTDLTFMRRPKRNSSPQKGAKPPSRRGGTSRRSTPPGWRATSARLGL